MSQAAAIIPANLKKLRSCMLCALVKSQLSFVQDGCENCEDVLAFKGDVDRVLSCTSQQFEGIIALMRPDKSWTARWQRVDKFHKGIYAIQVHGKLPLDVADELMDKGIKYRARDGTVKD